MIPHSFYFEDTFACNVKSYTELKPYIKRHNKEQKVITLIDNSIWDLEDGVWIKR